jgi:hypothetical protein
MREVDNLGARGLTPRWWMEWEADRRPNAVVSWLNMEQVPEIRVGDRGRDAAEARLKQAVHDGVLTTDEFTERIEVVLAAQTQGELARVLAAFPHPNPRRRQGRGLPEGGSSPSWATMRRVGVGVPPRAPALSRSWVDVAIDLRHAVFEQPEITITVMGDIDIIVPPDIEVEMTGFAILGDRNNRAVVPDDPGGPLVRMCAYVCMGDVNVTTKEPDARLPATSWLAL